MKNEGAKEGKDKDPKADDKDKEKEKWGLFIFVDRFLLYSYHGLEGRGCFS